MTAAAGITLNFDSIRVHSHDPTISTLGNTQNEETEDNKMDAYDKHT